MHEPDSESWDDEEVVDSDGTSTSEDELDALPRRDTDVSFFYIILY